MCSYEFHPLTCVYRIVPLEDFCGNQEITTTRYTYILWALNTRCNTIDTRGRVGNLIIQNNNKQKEPDETESLSRRQLGRDEFFIFRQRNNKTTPTRHVNGPLVFDTRIDHMYLIVALYWHQSDNHKQQEYKPTIQQVNTYTSNRIK